MLPATAAPKLPTMDMQAVTNVQRLEDEVAKAPQVEMPTRHLIHGGMYARTIKLSAGCVLTGALIKIPTVVVVNGDVTIAAGQPFRLVGYHVLPGSAGRKQAFVAHADTDITMLFPTQAQTVEEAEQEFTDEYERLMSRKCANEVVITGE